MVGRFFIVMLIVRGAILNTTTGWWFQIFLECSSLFGEIFQFDGCIFFQMGWWFNHQLDKVLGCLLDVVGCSNPIGSMGLVCLPTFS